VNLKRFICALFVCFSLVLVGQVEAQDTSAAAPAEVAAEEGFTLSVSMGDAATSGDWSVAIQLVLVMTLLSLAPTLLIMTTSFVRIVIVLGFVRQAMGAQHAPPNQVVIGLALLLTAFIMQPVWETVYAEAVTPFQNDELTAAEAWGKGSAELKDFMLSQVRPDDLDFIASMQAEPVVDGEVKFTVVAAAFIVSELRTAFQMGILIYLPFLIIDFVVASVLMSLGMMMMPPVMIALPCKLLLFVLVDGWRLVIDGLVRSFDLL
jgi:flagellar biosynthetic protein FliP